MHLCTHNDLSIASLLLLVPTKKVFTEVKYIYKKKVIGNSDSKTIKNNIVLKMCQNVLFPSNIDNNRTQNYLIFNTTIQIISILKQVKTD